MKLPAPIRTLTSACLLSAAVCGQVVISEVNLTPQNANDDQWIELRNLGPNKVDLDSWTVYQATKTVGRVNNYWFGFPKGTELQSGAYLRLHWMVPVKPTTPTDLYTGDTIYHFMFGYGAEPLDPKEGALALLNSQQNLDMNDPKFFRDWVSWGSGSFKRENIAAAAGQWVLGDFVPAPQQKDSIAWTSFRDASPTPATIWFRDRSPTSGADNHPAAALGDFGTNCAAGASPAPNLYVGSAATPGNQDFGFQVQNTSAGQIVALFLSASPGDGSITIGPCKLWVEVVPLPMIFSLTGTAPSTTFSFPIPVSGISNFVFYGQAAVLTSLGDYGLTQGVKVTVGT